MVGSLFLALFLPCAGMTAVFLVYICLLCYAASRDDPNAGQEFQSSVKPDQETGLSASDLDKIPEISGQDLILGADCAVCLDEITTEQVAKLIPGCNHGFHVQCIHAWLSKRSSCPICRADIGSDFFNPSETENHHADEV